MQHSLQYTTNHIGDVMISMFAPGPLHRGLKPR